jgi:hypothetical protein
MIRSSYCYLRRVLWHRMATDKLLWNAGGTKGPATVTWVTALFPFLTPHMLKAILEMFIKA